MIVSKDENNKKVGKPKILVLDIENSYLVGGVWGLWNQNISIDQMLDDGQMLCWSAKWLGDSIIMFSRHSNPEFLSWLWDLLNEADAVLTFNGRKHDIPFINREFIKAGYKPPSPYKHIDLYETVKKHFKFPSNKLQHILKELGLGSKLEHEGFKLWVKCLQGDPKAWDVMKRYNIKDVKLLEKAYNKFLPWISNHINHSLFAEDVVCPTCGSKHLVSRGFARTQVAMYRRFQCKDCGHWSRARYTEIDKDVRRNVLVSVAS